MASFASLKPIFFGFLDHPFPTHHHGGDRKTWAHHDDANHHHHPLIRVSLGAAPLWAPPAAPNEKPGSFEWQIRAGGERSLIAFFYIAHDTFTHRDGGTGITTLSSSSRYHRAHTKG